MPTYFPSQRILKGAIVTIDLPYPTPNVIVFQYNPGTLSRTLAAQTEVGEGESSGPVRFSGAPVETISLDVEIDATDQRETAESNAVEMGVHPQQSQRQKVHHLLAG